MRVVVKVNEHSWGKRRKEKIGSMNIVIRELFSDTNRNCMLGGAVS